MINKIEKMKAVEISLLTNEQKNSCFNESVIRALKISISDGNTAPANNMLKLLPLVTKKPGAIAALIKYFEMWGDIRFNSSRGLLIHSKKHIAPWTSEYEAQVRKNSWEKLIESQPKQPIPSVLDADDEFRKVLKRLQRALKDSTKTILHASLLYKVQEVLYAYGRTDEWTREDKRGRTLYDQSVKGKTIRASKYAKGA